MSSRCLEWKSGFVKFGKTKRFEINWHVRDWALPFGVMIYERMIFYNFLCISLIVQRRVKLDVRKGKYRRQKGGQQ